FFSSRRRHTRSYGDWSSDVCSSDLIYDQQGSLRNPGFLDYRIPTCLDLPLIETRIVEVASPDHPLGVRGVGEVSIVPPPAAVAKIGRASCRERVESGVVGGVVKKTI